MMKWRANFNWKLTAFVVFFLPILLNLGFWQLHRAEEKRAIQTAQAEQFQRPAMDIDAVTDSQRTTYQKVRMLGVFSEKQWLLDNQIYKGKFGYEVIQPFTTKQGEVWLVSRGWVQGSLNRSELPAVATPAGERWLEGYLYAPQASYELAGAVSAAAWPRVIAGIDVEKMYKEAVGNGKINAPFLLRLDQNDPQLLAAHWQMINVQPEKHTAYAMQWFGMALVLVILFIKASVKRENLTARDE